MTRPPIETAFRDAVTALSRAPRPLVPVVDRPVVPQLYFSWDAEKARVEMDLPEAHGALAVVRAKITGAPRWVCLSLALGQADLQPGAALGLAWDAACDPGRAVVPFLRSEAGGVKGDTYLGDPLRLGTERAEGVSLLGVDGGDAAVEPGRFHTLILPLPHVSFTLTLWDMRLFLRPAPAGRALALPRLGSAAR